MSLVGITVLGSVSALMLLVADRKDIWEVKKNLQLLTAKQQLMKKNSGKAGNRQLK